MRCFSLVLAGMSACLVSAPALADSFTDNLTPNVTLGLQFGGRSVHHGDALRFTALFDVRSQLLRRDPELARAAYASGESAAVSNLASGVPLLSVFEFGVNRWRLDVAHVFGQDMLAKSDQLNEQSDSHWYSHKWVWWTAGALAVGAAAAAAAGGHHSDTSNTNGGCDVASGPGVNGTSVNVQPTSGSNCPGS